MKSAFSYRVWQFWQSLKQSPDPADWEHIQKILTSRELALFKRLPIPDQNHSLRVLTDLEDRGESNPDLLKAALLHDIGKILYPLRRWERVFAVLMKGLFPDTAAKWGKMEPRGVQRPLVVIEQHAEWGADLAQKAGSSEMTSWLIRNHERREFTGLFDQAGVELLQILQLADNLN